MLRSEHRNTTFLLQLARIYFASANRTQSLISAVVEFCVQVGKCEGRSESVDGADSEPFSAIVPLENLEDERRRRARIESIIPIRSDTSFLRHSLPL